MSALCLTTFISGCVRTEVLTVTKTVAAVPPAYLWDSESLPTVPDGLPPTARTEALLDAYAARKDVILRDQQQEQLMRQWVEKIREVYPGSFEYPLEPLPEGTEQRKE